MRYKQMISLYVSPELFQRIDVAKGNFSRSSWIEHVLLEAMEKESVKM